MSKRLRVAALAGLSSISLVLASCSSDGNSEGTAAGGGQDTANTQAEKSGDNGEQLEVNAAGDYNPLERDQIQDGGELTLAITEIAEQQNLFHANMNLYTRSLWTTVQPAAFALRW